MYRLLKAGVSVQREDIFRMQKENPREKLNELIVPSNKFLLREIVDKAYLLVNKTSKDTVFISEQVGTKGLRSRMKTEAIKFLMKKYCDKGILPFYYEEKAVATGNHKYLLLYDKERKFHLTINQCRNLNKPAIPSGYRIRENQNFQSYFDFGSGEYKTMDVEDDSLYLELNHGHQSEKPMFIGLGIPKNNNEWYGVVDLVRETPVLSRKFATSPTEIKGIDVETFKESISNKG